MEQKQIGVVSNYFEHVGVAALKLTEEIKIGDKIRIVGGNTDFEQEIESMQIHHDKVESAKPGDEIGLRVKEKVRSGYKIYKI